MFRFVCLWLLTSSLGFAIPEGVVDDSALMQALVSKIESPDVKALKGVEMLEQIKKVEGKSLKLKTVPSTNHFDASKARKSIAILGVTRLCDKCPHPHLRSTATAWVVAEDGILVTNYHVLKSAQPEDTFGVVFDDGRVFGVKEVLAVDKDRDIAVFKIDAEGLAALPVGEDAPVGANLHLMSHPEGHFFTYAAGKVARYTVGKKSAKEGAGLQDAVIWMISTAEYALGSSGGPMMNDQGAVVGMVASTSTLYGTPRPNDMFKGGKTNLEEKDKTMVRDPQMVVRQCVAVCSLRALLYGEEQ